MSFPSAMASRSSTSGVVSAGDQSYRKNSSPTSDQQGKPMSFPLLYRYLHLHSFTEEELSSVFDRIHEELVHESEQFSTTEDNWIDSRHVQAFLVSSNSVNNAQIAESEAARIIQLLASDIVSNKTVRQSAEEAKKVRVAKAEFIKVILDRATSVDWKRTIPIGVSMLLVGASVGVVIPAMPFVVESLGLSTGQYGIVVSAFGLAKMFGNVPAAVGVERHGRKPYMTYSLALLAAGVGGIGFASSFEELYFCRLLTGLGVAALSTGGIMILADISTPLNRASTMAPVMSAFSAGAALGPALGGFLVDNVGLQSTFLFVGLSYLGVAAVNRALLVETRIPPLNAEAIQKTPLGVSARQALGQLVPLLHDPTVRSIVFMNCMYWVALAGAQMTLLPLLLTDVNRPFAMSATHLGSVYMGMSLVQIVGTPLFAHAIDRIGKAPAIVTGCTLISASMATLPHCTDLSSLACTLGVWSVGSSMLSTAPVSLISDRVSDEKRAQAIALLRTGGDLGLLVGAASIGAISDFTGSLDVAFHSSASVLAAATSWFAIRQFLRADSVTEIPAEVTAVVPTEPTTRSRNT
jgi:MFS family permease